MSDPNPAFEASGPQKIYFDGLKSGVFRIQRCSACSKHVFFPRVLCNHCGSPELAWVDASGKGTVYSTTVVRRKADAGGDINIALIDLEENVRLMSRVDGMAPEDVAIGMRVKAAIVTENEQPLLVFHRNEVAS